jgi:hypothetical protein
VARSKLKIIIEIEDSFIEDGEEMKNVGPMVMEDIARALKSWDFDHVRISEVD